MGKLNFLTISLMLLFTAGCAVGDITSLGSTVPTKEDVVKMKIGKTTKKEIREKFNGADSIIMQNMECDRWLTGNSVTGRGQVQLCNNEKGVLAQKWGM